MEKKTFSQRVRLSQGLGKKSQSRRYVFTLFLGCVVTLGMAVIAHRTSWLNRVRGSLLEANAPVMQSLNQAGHAIADAVADFQAALQISRTRQDLVQYKESSAYWYNESLRLLAENVALRRDAQFVGDQPCVQATATLITYPHLPFTHHFAISAGANAHIERNAPVVSAEGVVGRVIQVNPRSAHVLALTDVASRVPVYIAATDEHAILAGNHAQDAYLVLRQKDAVLPPDARIMTSGKCGIFPAGLLVGWSRGTSDRVRLANANPHALRHVFVLKSPQCAP